MRRARSSLCVCMSHTANADTLRAYLRQVREEVGLRLVVQAYTPEGSHNKFWLAFSRKRFMNLSL